MKVILFLGAGVSIESGYPNAHDLTEIILKQAEHEKVSLFLKHLYLYHQEVGYRKNYRAKCTYEDLFYLCEQIFMYDIGLHDSIIVDGFIETLLERVGNILESTNKQGKILELGRIATLAKRHINKQIVESLSRYVEIKGLDLIVQLAKSPKITQLDIVTLNHDLLIERLLHSNGIEFIDGFGIADGDVRWFSPETYQMKQKVKLLKLHGSVDVFNIGHALRPGKLADFDLDNKKNHALEKLEFANKNPIVLTGLNKTFYYNYGMHIDLHFQFQKLLYERDLVLMSGYGWGDDPINTRLEQWMDMCNTRKIVLMHHKQYFDSLISNNLMLDRSYTQWSEQNRLKLIPKWLCQTSLEEIMQICEKSIQFGDNNNYQAY